MTDQSLWYLENIDVNGIFCPKKIGRGDMDQHVHKHYKKGDYIYLPNEHADKIYFLTEGRVKIGTYGDSGKEITKAILGPGEVFGELSLIGEDKRRDFTYAMEDTVVCVMSVQDMKNMMRDHNALSLFLMKIMGSRMLEMEQRLESLVFKDSRTRIIEFLHELGEKKGQRVGYEMLVRKFITHQEIANLTATSRQTVTTVLNELRNANIITFNRKRLLIRDMESLAKAAAG
ncbi:MAG: Crp/Fnr family transcriptional regulator [Phaeodactylibacter sp.]|nr:Crp/Fnr family transcriptional regulator [Phaeodactylibacter sp.]MCB9299618.1 Crp/Fnr family transcriptional regulator [Lewinellaceae bacterium]HQU60023.1 Crp/Fnr family transcriptional regulator [Saprospiraceae bacterium]